MELDLYVLALVVQNWIFYQGDRSFVVHVKYWWIAFSSISSSISRTSQTPCVAAIEATMYSASQEDKTTTFYLNDCQQIAQSERK